MPIMHVKLKLKYEPGKFEHYFDPVLNSTHLVSPDTLLEQLVNSHSAIQNIIW